MMKWIQDPADYSWFATDALGYFYRVSGVFDRNGLKGFACAWTEMDGFRQSPRLYDTAKEGMQQMDNIASLPDKKDVA